MKMRVSSSSCGSSYNLEPSPSISPLRSRVQAQHWHLVVHNMQLSSVPNPFVLVQSLHLDPHVRITEPKTAFPSRRRIYAHTHPPVFIPPPPKPRPSVQTQKVPPEEPTKTDDLTRYFGQTEARSIRQEAVFLTVKGPAPQKQWRESLGSHTDFQTARRRSS